MSILFTAFQQCFVDKVHQFCFFTDTLFARRRNSSIDEAVDRANIYAHDLYFLYQDVFEGSLSWFHSSEWETWKFEMRKDGEMTLKVPESTEEKKFIISSGSWAQTKYGSYPDGVDAENEPIFKKKERLIHIPESGTDRPGLTFHFAKDSEICNFIKYCKFNFGEQSGFGDTESQVRFAAVCKTVRDKKQGAFLGRGAYGFRSPTSSVYTDFTNTQRATVTKTQSSDLPTDQAQRDAATRTQSSELSTVWTVNVEHTTSPASTSQPSTSQPSTSEPSTSEPSTSEPSTSEPSTSQPSTSQQ